jgi:hypothetical protein
VWPVSVLCGLLLGWIGCARGPAGGGEPIDLPAEALILMRAIIVDVNPELRTITVKEDRVHETWTVAVTDETRIVSSDGALLVLEDLRIGQRLQIRGRSRYQAIVTALEVAAIPEKDR